VRLKDIVWVRPVVVAASGIDLHVSLRPNGHGEVAYELYSGPVDDEIVHGRGVAMDVEDSRAPEPHDLAVLRERCLRGHFSAAQCYAVFDTLGLHYGTGFRGLSELFAGEALAVGRITLPDSPATASAPYVLHPSLLDAALQASVGLVLEPGAEPPGLMLPFAMGSLDMFAPCTAAMWAVVRPSAGTEKRHVRSISICATRTARYACACDPWNFALRGRGTCQRRSRRRPSRQTMRTSVLRAISYGSCRPR
jgi:polyketide synthase PksN